MLLFAQHKQGHRLPVEVTVAPLRDRTGQTVGAVEVFKDLTQAVEDLRRARVVQDYILQREFPADPPVHFEVSYRPEEVVGGDFYRDQPMDRDRYTIMVADAMGRSPPKKRAYGRRFDDLNIFLQGPGIIVPVPGNAVVGQDRRHQRPEVSGLATAGPAEA